MQNSHSLKQYRQYARLTPEEKKKFRRSKKGQVSRPKRAPTAHEIAKAKVKTKECPRCTKEKHLSLFRWIKHKEDFSKWCIECLDKDIAVRKKQKNRRNAQRRYDKAYRKIKSANKHKKRAENAEKLRQRDKEIKADVERRLAMKKRLFDLWLKGGGLLELQGISDG